MAGGVSTLARVLALAADGEDGELDDAGQARVGLFGPEVRADGFVQGHGSSIEFTVHSSRFTVGSQES